MWHLLLITIGAVIVGGAVVGAALYHFYPVQVSTEAGLARSAVLSWSAPPGTMTTETNPDYKAAAAVSAPPDANLQAPGVAPGDWPSYNRTLTSERFSPLTGINAKNVGKLKVLCTYDAGEFASFESGLIMVNNALIGTTEFDIFSLNPATCALNWKTHEEYPPALLSANRGAAYMDGMLFRGT